VRFKKRDFRLNRDAEVANATEAAAELSKIDDRQAAETMNGFDCAGGRSKATHYELSIETVPITVTCGLP
jgi:hypothetical protein